jgi:hypothetical protein
MKEQGISDTRVAKQKLMAKRIQKWACLQNTFTSRQDFPFGAHMSMINRIERRANHGNHGHMRPEGEILSKYSF